VPGTSTAYDAWSLHVPGGDGVPPRALAEVAELVGRFRERTTERAAAVRGAGEALAALLTGADADAGALSDALAACGALPGGPWRVVVARTDGREAATLPRAALAEALLLLPPGTAFAVGAGSGEALAVVRDAERLGALLADAWPLVGGCRPDTPLHAGVSAAVAEPGALPAAVTQARYACTVAARRSPGGHRASAVEDLASVESLLAGVPAEVREVFSRVTLGPLADGSAGSHGALLETLEAFLAHNCSWARTAQALHLHVNTVHYRIDRIRVLTGRDLTRLDHRLDLWAALRCR
ncbi:PucR family transcriptional regulator, partial [Streptomyces sp. SID5785]|uniref:PucR family transcriptional regulator n=1 Tax=Streptomyces sp. SID5785 TaxID=2690309 RepID=UPI001361C257